VAQPQNWTSTYASLSDQRWDLPVGLQVTAIGSHDDFLVALRDLLVNEPTMAALHDNVKVKAAESGPDAYWQAKSDFLQHLIRSRELRPR
jgi:GrpB-like predicted nucleotidyltransferase (UPF0157 family)